MKIENVVILSHPAFGNPGLSPGAIARWWANVRVEGKPDALHVNLTISLSWDEYQELLDRDRKARRAEVPEPTQVSPTLTVTPGPGWELVKPEDGMKEGDPLTIGGVFHSNAYGHDVELTGVFGDGTVYYRILSGERQGEEHFKHVTHFRATYSPKKEQP